MAQTTPLTHAGLEDVSAKLLMAADQPRDPEPDGGPRVVYQLFSRHWRELLLVNVRFLVFLVLQLLFSQMAESSGWPAAPMASTLMITSYCWLLAGGMWVVYAVLMGVGAWIRARCLGMRDREGALAVGQEEEEGIVQSVLDMYALRKKSLIAHIWERLWPSQQALMQDIMRAHEEEEQRTRQAPLDQAYQFGDEGRVQYHAYFADEAEDPPQGQKRLISSSMGFDAFPHAVWSCMNTCGVVLFVVGYSINGVFWFPQLCLVGAVLLVLLFPKDEATPDNNNNTTHAIMAEEEEEDVDGPIPSAKQHEARRRRRRPLCRSIGLAGLLLGLVLLFVDQGAKTTLSQHGQTMMHNFWLGGALPFGVGWTLKDWHRYRPQEGAPQGTIRAQSVLSFATPSLVILSATYLSLYFPTQQCTTLLYDNPFAVRRQAGGGGEGDPLPKKGNSSSTAIMMLIQNSHNNNNHNLGGNASSFMDQFLKTDAMALLINLTHAYYGMLASPSNSIGMATIGVPQTASDLLAAVMAPSLMWVALTIVIGCGLRTPSRAGSTAGVYVLSIFFRQILFDFRITGWLVLGVVVCKLSIGCILHTELHQIEFIAQREQEGTTRAKQLYAAKHHTQCLSDDASS